MWGSIPCWGARVSRVGALDGEGLAMAKCDLCGREIPQKKTSRNTYVLLDWVVYEMAGAFCSEGCASRAAYSCEKLVWTV